MFAIISNYYKWLFVMPRGGIFANRVIYHYVIIGIMVQVPGGRVQVSGWQGSDFA